jgi:hypothetical protein
MDHDHLGGGGQNLFLLTIVGAQLPRSERRPTRMVSGQFPLHTKTNNSDWSAKMHVMLHDREMWVTVKDGATNEVKDHMATSQLRPV